MGGGGDEWEKWEMGLGLENLLSDSKKVNFFPIAEIYWSVKLMSECLVDGRLLKIRGGQRNANGRTESHDGESEAKVRQHGQAGTDELRLDITLADAHHMDQITAKFAES